MILELDADLPLVGLVPDEGVLQQLLSGGPLGVVLHQAALDEAEELLRPAMPFKCQSLEYFIPTYSQERSVAPIGEEGGRR